MSPLRPDLVDVWIFRPIAGEAATDEGTGPASSAPVEFLLLRRAKGDAILPGLWQGVSGGLEPRESSVDAAVRELSEETGFGPDQIDRFYHLDQVNQFLDPSSGGILILSAIVFAVRVKPGAEPVLSHEHDMLRWVSPDQALELAVWPAYRESIRRIVENLLDPERASWFELTLEGERARR
jgi:8-oxo-dGTP pyrophosphatase MutT (NUDIX family)